jgi:hypothetical protein
MSDDLIDRLQAAIDDGAVSEWVRSLLIEARAALVAAATPSVAIAAPSRQGAEVIAGNAGLMD